MHKGKKFPCARLPVFQRNELGPFSRETCRAVDDMKYQTIRKYVLHTTVG
jgi:hypothetical protein